MDQGLPPAFYPGQYDPTGALHNPGRTAPGPFPRDIASAAWCGARAPLHFVPGAVASRVLLTATWRSPIFDLRPYLRPVGAAPGQDRLGVQPVWLPMGGGGTLFTQTVLDSATVTGLNVTSQESGHPTDFNRIATITGQQDISTIYASGKQAACAPFRAPGEGYPLRYWQVTLVFEIYEAGGAPNMAVEAGYY